MKKLLLFDQNHWLSALQKGQLCLLFKSMFILSRQACFLTRTSRNFFLWVYFSENELLRKLPIFWSNPWTNPFWKMPILWVFCFGCSERVVWYIKRRESFFTIYFRDLWHGNTVGYTRLLGVKRRYKGLQGVTRGYKGLQGVTRGKKGLKRIIETFS